MTTDLTVAPATATIAEAAQLMSLRQVGSVLVLDDDELLGIFTERDVVRALATEFDAAGHPIATWMTAEPATMTPDDDPGDALRAMLSGGFRHVPVLDAGRVVGIVSIRDLAPR